MLDLCFSNEKNIDCLVTWNHWSDHKIVLAVLLDSSVLYYEHNKCLYSSDNYGIQQSKIRCK